MCDEVMDILTMEVDAFEAYLDLVSDNTIAFGLICGWVLYDLEFRRQQLNRLLDKFVICEILDQGAIAEAFSAIDGQESSSQSSWTTAATTQCLQQASTYEQLPLRAKVKHWSQLCVDDKK